MYNSSRYVILVTQCAYQLNLPLLERTGSDMQLRTRAPGLLIPDVLLNEDSNSPFEDGKCFERMKKEDSNCDLLLILGTSLKSHGAACLVRDLARLLHTRGGM